MPLVCAVLPLVISLVPSHVPVFLWARRSGWRQRKKPCVQTYVLQVVSDSFDRVWPDKSEVFERAHFSALPTTEQREIDGASIDT